MRTFGLVIHILLLALVPGTVSAQSGWDPLTGVPQLVAGFSRLNEQVDKGVVAEKRGQLMRAVDRLRKDLYALEADARVLQDSIPDSVPNLDERNYLERLARELQETVGWLTETARQIGADLRLNEAEQVEEALTSGLRTRGAALSYFQRELEGAEQGRWNASNIRSRLGQGIDAVRAAQLAVTSFRQKLSQTR